MLLLTAHTFKKSQIIKEKLAPVCVKIHIAVQHAIKQYREKARRHFHVTPSSYLELLTLFVVQLKSRNEMLTVARYTSCTDYIL